MTFNVRVVSIFAAAVLPSMMHGADPPYPKSKLITGVRFNDSSLRMLAPGSDNWPVAWAANGKLYTTWGDGGGFGGTNSSGRVGIGIAVVEGNKDNYRGTNILGGKDAKKKLPFNGKSEGILAIGDRLYLWRNGNASGTGAFRFTQLWRSDDLGRTWRFTGVEFSKSKGDFPKGDEGCFSPTFCQFGRGYNGARDNYVYSYAPEIIDRSHWNVQKPGRIALFRVRKEQMEKESAYEFFAGMDRNNAPKWTQKIGDRKPVWQNRKNGTHRMAVSYNPGLRRYLLTTMTVNRHGWLAIYEAPEPWGPWSTVLFEQNQKRWGGKVVVFNFVNKWLSPNGRQFVLVYTRNDHWATIEGKFTVAGDKFKSSR